MLLYPKAGPGRSTAMLLSQQNLFLGGMNSFSQASLLNLASPRDKQSREPIDVRIGRTVRTSAAGKHSFQPPLGISRQTSMWESLQLLCSPIAAHYVDRIWWRILYPVIVSPVTTWLRFNANISASWCFCKLMPRLRLERYHDAVSASSKLKDSQHALEFGRICQR